MSHKKTILILSQVFPNEQFPQNGTFVIERIKRMKKEFNIIVISPQPYVPSIWPFNTNSNNWNKLKSIPTVDTIEGIQTYYPRYFTMPKQMLLFMEGFMYYLSIKKLVKNIKPDLIQAYFALPDGHAASLIKNNFNTPFVVTVLGSDINIYPKKIFCKKLINKIIGNANQVLACSHKLKFDAKEINPKVNNIKVIPNGFDPDVFSNNNKEILNEVPKKYILFVGNLLPIKGVDILIESIKYLQTKIPIILIGKGEKKWLKQHINPDIEKYLIFLGPKKHHEIALYMRQSTLFVLPSRNEGLPTVLAENMALGKPAVASKVGGIPEIINEKNGILVNKEDPKLLAKAIDSALTKQWDKEEIIKQSKKFTWDRIVKHETAIYKELI